MKDLSPVFIFHENSQEQISAMTIMGQRWARQEVDEGVQLYHQQKHEAAIQKWHTALRKLRRPDDKFITLGYLTQANCESGRYKDMLTYALHQIELANEQDDNYMRAEAYLNLARANERMAEYHKAVSYGRHCLQYKSQDPRTPGYSYLCMGSAYLGFSNFQKALEHLELGMQVANFTQDRLLELQVCVGLGALFTQLKDLNKAILFFKNSLPLLTTVSIDDVRTKYKSLIFCHLSTALRKRGNFEEAKSKCEEALKLAVNNGNRPIEARCLLALGDILRDIDDIDSCWPRYDSALQLVLDMGDRLGQVHVLNSMAKCASVLQNTKLSPCECQAIMLNNKCLELAKSVGCKLVMLKCEARLQHLYSKLSDEENEESAKKSVVQYAQEMELFCNFCGQRYGLRDDALQALTCSHIFHERCLKNFLATRERKFCPKCHRSDSYSSSSANCTLVVSDV